MTRLSKGWRRIQEMLEEKITVIDGKIGYTGGYNLANEYFNIISWFRSRGSRHYILCLKNVWMN